MLDTTNKIEFIRQGLVRYPDARDTVDYFQTSVMEAIFAAFEAKAGWRNFQPLRNAEQGFEFGKFIGQVDRYIQAWIAGALPNVNGTQQKAWLALGLFWKPPRRPSASVVAACNAWTEKGVALPLFDIPGRDQRILVGAIYRKAERRLFLEPGEDFDPSEVFSLLLDAADDALTPPTIDAPSLAPM